MAWSTWLIALTSLVATSDLPQTDGLSALIYDRFPCPVCEEVFNTLVCIDGDAKASVDRDLFARALGPQPVYYLIHTCPGCGYSGYTGDFHPETEIAPEVRDKILTSPKLPLPSHFGPESDPRELPADERYRLAVQSYQWLDRSDEALAWLHLRASWVARDEGSVLPPDPRLVRVIRFIQRWRPSGEPGDNPADLDLEAATRVAETLALGGFNRYQKPYVELALALVLRRHGENVGVDETLRVLTDRAAAEREKGEEATFARPLVEGIGRMRASIAREREHQASAASYFEKALEAGQVDAGNRPVACYLLGELYRRLGRDAEAVRWYDAALADPALPDELRTWARQQREAVSRSETGS